MDTAVKLGEEEKSKPITAWWHTVLLIVILLGIAVRGAMFQSASLTSPELARNVLPVYLSLLISEFVLLWAVWMGSRRTGTSLSDLIGGRWRTSREVVVDVFLGIAFWAIVMLFADAWDRLLPIAGHARSISPLLPHGPVEIAVWIPLSAVGGVVEEIVFRGYFQRQFQALTSRRWAAVALQGTLFGVTHGYQGAAACIKITLIGVMFGMLAAWRRSLRPGMIAHVWTDIFSGVLRS
jgi:membrane protease YdiL (CAAX protease family)